MTNYVVYTEDNTVTLILLPGLIKKWLQEIGIVKATVIGSCNISSLPGCSAVGIINNFKIYPEYENLGYGKILLNQAIFNIGIKNYSKIIATVNQNSPKMHTLLKAKGFVKADTFLNLKTNNTISLYIL